MDGWVEALAEHGRLRLPALLRCGRVSRRWQEAMRCALLTLRALDFRGCEGRATGPDVLAVLERTAGASLTAIDLAHCRRLNAADVEQILACVAATCPCVAEIDLTGCRDRSVLRAVAVRARDALAATSPLDLYVHLEALSRAGDEKAEESVGGKCSFGHVCTHLRTLRAPHLVLDPEFAPEEDAGDSDSGEESAGDSESEAEDTASYYDRLLIKEASEGSGWGAALLLGVSFGEDDGGNARVCDCDAHDRSGRGALHLAARRGDADMVSLLLLARADTEAEDERGNTPLLLACTSGHLELAQMLLDRGADASAANAHGDTPLLAAVAAGDAQLARALQARGASLKASREDGANVLALAILSQNEACIQSVLLQGPKRLAGQDALDSCAFIPLLAQAFLDPARIGAWLGSGASPSALMAEIGVLLLSAEVGAAVKDQLEHVRAFLDYHEELLSDRGCWPVARAEQLVAQLASQEADAIFESVESGAEEAAVPTAMIEWMNKPQARRLCRRTLKTRMSVRAVAVSPDGSRLAYAAEWSKVMVRNLQTGLVVLELSSATTVLCIDWHDNRIAAGCYDRKMRVFDAQSGDCLCTVSAHSEFVRAVAWSPCGRWLASGGDDSMVYIYDTQTFEAKWPLMGHDREVLSLAWSPDGARLVTGSVDRTVRIWDASTGEELWQLICDSHVLSVDWHDNRIVAGCADGRNGQIKVFDAQSGDCLSTLEVEGSVSCVVWSPCGYKIAAACNAAVLNAYGNDHYCVRILDSETGALLCVLTGHRYASFPCMLNPAS